MKKITRYIVLALTIVSFSIYFNFFHFSSKIISDDEKISIKTQATKSLKYKTTTELAENNHPKTFNKTIDYLITTLILDDVKNYFYETY